MQPSRDLALFPLQAVFFPGGRITLQVFEARYLDLMGRCLREGSDFGIVHLEQGLEVRRPGDTAPRFASVGVTARIDQVDVPRAGLMLVSLVAQRRFRMGATSCGDNGLWSTRAIDLPDDLPGNAPTDAPVVPAATHAALAQTLRELLARMGERGVTFAGEPRFDDVGWLAWRWCELLPITASERQALLEVDDAAERLARIDRWLATRRGDR